jgi:cell shape-determining protein MreC
MKSFEPSSTKPNWLTPRRAVLAATLGSALALGFASSRIASPLRSAWRDTLRPGLEILDATIFWAADLRARLHSGEDAGLAQSQRQIAELNDRLRRAELQLQLAQSDRVADAASVGIGSKPTSPLLTAQTVSARVLGQQAQSFLDTRAMLDAGRSRGVTARSLVIDDLPTTTEKAVVDQGQDASIRADHLVLTGSRVWGKIAEVGQHTSSVIRVTDSGFRDLVQLASSRDGKLQFLARGVLVGKGEPLCQIELVETGAAVTVGDLVFTADDGVLDAPLLYGRVARLERKPGAAHWEIWMEPAVSATAPPARVAVLRLDLNPARLASGP